MVGKPNVYIKQLKKSFYSYDQTVQFVTKKYKAREVSFPEFLEYVPEGAYGSFHEGYELCVYKDCPEYLNGDYYKIHCFILPVNAKYVHQGIPRKYGYHPFMLTETNHRLTDFWGYPTSSDPVEINLLIELKVMESETFPGIDY